MNHTGRSKITHLQQRALQQALADKFKQRAPRQKQKKIVTKSGTPNVSPVQHGVFASSVPREEITLYDPTILSELKQLFLNSQQLADEHKLAIFSTNLPICQNISEQIEFYLRNSYSFTEDVAKNLKALIEQLIPNDLGFNYLELYTIAQLDSVFDNSKLDYFKIETYPIDFTVVLFWNFCQRYSESQGFSNASLTPLPEQLLFAELAIESLKTIMDIPEIKADVDIIESAIDYIPFSQLAGVSDMGQQIGTVFLDAYKNEYQLSESDSMQYSS